MDVANDKPRRARRSDDRGAALVEMAIAVPVFVSIMLGTITSGLALNDELQVTHAAREGARYGATVPDAEVFSSGTWATNVRVVVVDRFGSGLAPGDVCVALVEGASPVPLSATHTTKSDGSACYDDSSAGVVSARVQVTVEKASFIDTALYRHDMVLSSEAVAQHESNG